MIVESTDDIEVAKRMWAQILTEAKYIEDNCLDREAVTRTQAMIDADKQGMSCILDIKMKDGSHQAFHIHSRFVIEVHHKSLKLQVKKYFHNNETFWDEQFKERSNAVIVNGKHYRFESDLPPSRSNEAGFAGRTHYVRFYNGKRFKGRILVTKNLWLQGKIPPALRKRFPDNAEFITKQEAESESKADNKGNEAGASRNKK